MSKYFFHTMRFLSVFIILSLVLSAVPAAAFYPARNFHTIPLYTKHKKPKVIKTRVAPGIIIASPQSGDLVDRSEPLVVTVDYEAWHLEWMKKDKEKIVRPGSFKAIELLMNGQSIELQELAKDKKKLGVATFTIAPENFSSDASEITLQAVAYDRYKSWKHWPSKLSEKEAKSHNHIAVMSEVVTVKLVLTVQAMRQLAKQFHGTLDPAGDADGDGLTNGFELYTLILTTRPDQADTDENGVSDAQEDADADGLTNLQEQAKSTNPHVPDTDEDGLTDGAEVNVRGTDPTKKDSDGDGLDDGLEIELGTNPLNPDSDGDGVPDGQDTLAFSLADADSGVTLAIKGQGDLKKHLQIASLKQEPVVAGASAFRSAISIHNTGDGRLEEAVISMPYDPALDATAVNNLVIAHFNTDTGALAPLTEQVINTADHTVSGKTTHFSTFVLYDKVKMQELFATEFFGSIRGGGGSIVLVFSIDSSGSMVWNDPTDVRKSVSKDLIDSLEATDKVGVVDFDSYARIFQAITTDKEAAKRAVDRINSSGGTDIGAAVKTANTMLINEAGQGSKIQILLTDGEGTYSSALTQQAKDNGIVIYTIGLGSSVDEALLRSIAVGTGGAYFQVSHAGDLVPIFQTIKDETKDTDGDGLSNLAEMSGMRTDWGFTLTSDPNNPDTDGDGLSDGEEMGSTATGIFGRYYNLRSDPNKADSDDDGITDGEENDAQSSPLLSDTDSDGLSDFVEEGLNTDATSPDTDQDGFNDKFEHEHRDDYDPLAVTETVSKARYIWEFARGAALGEIIELDTIPAIAGSIVAGFVVWGDITDILGGLIHADVVSVATGVGGFFVPVLGDVAKGGVKVGKYMIKFPTKAGDALRMFTKIVPEELADDALRLTLKSYDSLKNAGFSSQAIKRLAKSGHNPDDLAKALTEAAGTPKITARAIGRDADGFFTGDKGWRNAEEYLREGTPRPGRYPPPGTSLGFISYPDAVINRVAQEAKTGHVKMSARIRKQIEKYKKLVDAGELDGTEWHFFPSGRSGSIGADQSVLDLLKANMIPYFIHVP